MISEMRGPFALEIEWSTPDGQRATYTDPEFVVAQRPKEIVLHRAIHTYQVKLTLNGDLAYLGIFANESPSDLLF